MGWLCCLFLWYCPNLYQTARLSQHESAETERWPQKERNERNGPPRTDRQTDRQTVSQSVSQSKRSSWWGRRLIGPSGIKVGDQGYGGRASSPWTGTRFPVASRIGPSLPSRPPEVRPLPSRWLPVARGQAPSSRIHTPSRCAHLPPAPFLASWPSWLDGSTGTHSKITPQSPTPTLAPVPFPPPPLACEPVSYLILFPQLHQHHPLPVLFHRQSFHH